MPGFFLCKSDKGFPGYSSGVVLGFHGGVEGMSFVPEGAESHGAIEAFHARI